jgi:hypothetical protein
MKTNEKALEILFLKAEMAGMEAATATTVTPMIVSQHENPFNDASPVEKSWFVEGGVCGFAWVNIKPGNCPFANWMKKNKGAGKDYYGGTSYSIHEYGQSMTRKEAHARAFAGVLNESGIKAYCMSRMD